MARLREPAVEQAEAIVAEAAWTARWTERLQRLAVPEERAAVILRHLADARARWPSYFDRGLPPC